MTRVPRPVLLFASTPMTLERQGAMLLSRIRPHLFSRNILLKPFSSSRSLSSSIPITSSPPDSTASPPPDPTTFAPPASSPHHHSLPTFLAYAARTSLSPASTVYIGTYYEYLCLLTLPRLGFYGLVRTGGRADFGIDLLGLWQLPSLPHPLRVLVQCKATKAKPAPERIRELEGAMAGAPDGWRGANTVGVLCAKQSATRGVREAVRRSGIPVVWVMVEEQDKGAGIGLGRVRQVLWNEKVATMGAEGVGVGVRYANSSHHAPDEKKRSAAAGGLEKEAVLLWEGQEWSPSVKEAEGSEDQEDSIKEKSPLSVPAAF